MTLVDDIVDFVRGNRVPVNRGEVVIEIMQVAQCNPAWPKAGPGAWDAAIDAAVIAGRLVESGGMVGVAPLPGADEVSGQQGNSRKSRAVVKDVQLSLFD